MLGPEFIFSKKWSDRIKRHLLFWICWWLFLGTITAANVYYDLSHLQELLYTLKESILLLVPQVVVVYPLLYFVRPRYLLKNKYISAFLWTAVFVAFGAFINLIIPRYVNVGPFTQVLLEKNLPPAGWSADSFNFRFVVVLSGVKTGIGCAAVAISLKFIKDWYLKEQRNLQLQEENTQAQLQLLTAQVHPHFLFNTLNNIYSKAQLESPGSAKMILELSHILRYVLDEGKHELVPLENELQMIKDYINLERQRYDDKLDLYVSFPSKTENVYIAPLLLLPFVENSFKHGTSKMLNNPWINLKIELKDTSFLMKLMNGKKQSTMQHNDRNGTGIENVRKRLDLLYKNKYTLQINEDEEVFVINLTMELVKTDKTVPVQSQTTSASAYE